MKMKKTGYGEKRGSERKKMLGRINRKMEIGKISILAKEERKRVKRTKGNINANKTRENKINNMKKEEKERSRNKEMYRKARSRKREGRKRKKRKRE